MATYIGRKDRVEVKRLHREGYHVETIATVLNLPEVQVAQAIEAMNRIPRWRNATWTRTRDAVKQPEPLPELPDGPTPDQVANNCYMPTLADIRRECEGLRAKWSAAERCRRSGGMDGATGTVELAENVEVSVSRKGIRGTHQ